MFVKFLGTDLTAAKITLSSPRCTMHKRARYFPPSGPFITFFELAFSPPDTGLRELGLW